MSKRKSVAGVARKARAVDAKFRAEVSKKSTKDSFTNFTARLGFGGGNQLSSGYYNFDFLTRNRTQLEAAYRTSWIIRQAVDCGAEDMVRAGIEFEGTLPPDQIDLLQASMLDCQIWQRLCDTNRWARLFGGCIAVMLVDGQDVSTPLDVETVGSGMFKGLLVLDRWLVQPNLTNLITKFGPELGMPKYYNVVADAHALAAMSVHHSRVLRMDGLPLPYYQQLVENGWGESIIENIHDRVLAFDSSTMGAAQLAFKAHLRTLNIEGLRDIIAAGGPAYEGLLAQMEFIRYSQSNEGMTVLDGTDKFDTHTYSFAGLSDVILQMAQQLSGALQIPLIRLLGQSPAGLNSSGDSDLRTYYDNVGKQQEQKLRRPLTRLIDVMSRSLDIKLPSDFAFKFKPLWMLTETEKADIAAKDSTTITNALDAGTISQSVAMKELKQSSRVSGRFSNISDEDIASADEDATIPKGETALDPEGKEDAEPDDK